MCLLRPTLAKLGGELGNLPALGAALTVPTQEHKDYQGVKVEGSTSEIDIFASSTCNLNNNVLAHMDVSSWLWRCETLPTRMWFMSSITIQKFPSTSGTTCASVWGHSPSTVL